MKQYERIVSYIYRYNQDIKGANVGYARVEKRGAFCRLFIQMRALPLNSVPQVYLYRQEENSIQTVLAGQMMARGSSLLCKVNCESENVFGTNQTIDEMDGIFIYVERQNYFATSWKNDTFYLGNWEEPVRKDAESEEMGEEQNKTAETVAIEEGVAEKIAESMVAEESSQDMQMQSICGVCPFKRKAYDYGKKILMTFPSMKPFEPGVVTACVRMELQDIGCLPIASWPLSGNRFLLHGYYCYRHLIFAQLPDGRYVLGVPGIYSEKEKSNALRFGFPRFQSIGDFGAKQGAFGYWMLVLPGTEQSELLPT